MSYRINSLFKNEALERKYIFKDSVYVPDKQQPLLFNWPLHIILFKIVYFFKHNTKTKTI